MNVEKEFKKSDKLFQDDSGIMIEKLKDSCILVRNFETIKFITQAF